MISVAVTGATGFIGRYVVAELERRSVSPVIVCREAPNQASLSRHRVARVDLHDPAADVFAQLGRPEVLIHLAWGGLPNYRSAHHFDRESPAHFRFLKLLIESGLRRLLVTGTCYEYGMQSGPLSEASETRPVTAYGFGKDILRRQLDFLAPYTGAAITWARLFYPFGDGQAPTSLWPQLKQAVEQGNVAFDMSAGEQLRDYLSVEDVARHIVSLALADHGFGIVNICSGQPTSIRRLVEGWLTTNGWSIELNLGRYPYPEYEPMAFWGNAEKLHRILDGLPST